MGGGCRGRTAAVLQRGLCLGLRQHRRFAAGQRRPVQHTPAVCWTGAVSPSLTSAIVTKGLCSTGTPFTSIEAATALFCIVARAALLNACCNYSLLGQVHDDQPGLNAGSSLGLMKAAELPCSFTVLSTQSTVQPAPIRLRYSDTATHNCKRNLALASFQHQSKTCLIICLTFMLATQRSATNSKRCYTVCMTRWLGELYICCSTILTRHRTARTYAACLTCMPLFRGFPSRD